MQFNKLNLLLCHYREILTLNLVMSVGLGILGIPAGQFFTVFSIGFISGGYFASLLYYELTKSNQYYFYYNKGISRFQLYLSGFVFNLVGVSVVLILLQLWKIFWK
jgi:hypothetical protein